MKNLSVARICKYLIAILLFNYAQLVCLAQDSTTSKTVRTTTTEHREWYSIPWVWVVGGIIVLLLLIAAISSGRRSSRTTITDTGAGTRTITTDEN